MIIFRDHKILGFYAEDPKSKKPYFFLPGGKVEKGESALESALRESLEETGYRVEPIPQIYERKSYEFFWNGQTYETDTEFFLGRVLNDTPEEVADAPYHRGMAWVSVDEIDAVFSYHPVILAVVKSFKLKFEQLR